MAARYAAVTFAEHTKPRYVNPSLNLVALNLRRVSSMTVAKYIERRIIRAWKSFSRKPCRASVMMEDKFVILTAKRRSVMYAPPSH